MAEEVKGSQLPGPSGQPGIDPKNPQPPVPGGPSTPQGEPIAVVGERKYYSVDEMIADVTEKERLIGRQGKEIGDLKRGNSPQHEPIVPSTRPKGTDYDTLFFTNPQEAVNAIKRETTEELELRYRWEKMWEGFYSLNPDLDGDLERKIVGDSYTTLYQDIKELDTKEGLKKIASHARKNIVALAKKGDQMSVTLSEEQNPVILSGSGGPVPQRLEPEIPDISITDLLKKKVSQRKAASRRVPAQK